MPLQKGQPWQGRPLQLWPRGTSFCNIFHRRSPCLLKLHQEAEVWLGPDLSVPEPAQGSHNNDDNNNNYCHSDSYCYRLSWNTTDARLSVSTGPCIASLHIKPWAGRAHQVYSCWAHFTQEGTEAPVSEGGAPAGERGPEPALPSLARSGGRAGPSPRLVPAVLSDRSDPAQHVIPVLSLKEIFTEASAWSAGTRPPLGLAVGDVHQAGADADGRRRPLSQTAAAPPPAAGPGSPPLLAQRERPRPQRGAATCFHWRRPRPLAGRHGEGERGEGAG